MVVCSGKRPGSAAGRLSEGSPACGPACGRAGTGAWLVRRSRCPARSQASPPSQEPADRCTGPSAVTSSRSDGKVHSATPARSNAEPCKHDGGVEHRQHRTQALTMRSLGRDPPPAIGNGTTNRREATSHALQGQTGRTPDLFVRSERSRIGQIRTRGLNRTRAVWPGVLVQRWLGRTALGRALIVVGVADAGVCRVPLRCRRFWSWPRRMERFGSP